MGSRGIGVPFRTVSVLVAYSAPKRTKFGGKCGGWESKPQALASNGFLIHRLYQFGHRRLHANFRCARVNDRRRPKAPPENVGCDLAQSAVWSVHWLPSQ